MECCSQNVSYYEYKAQMEAQNDERQLLESYGRVSSACVNSWRFHACSRQAHLEEKYDVWRRRVEIIYFLSKELHERSQGKCRYHQSSTNPGWEVTDSSSLAFPLSKPRAAIILWPGESTSYQIPSSKWQAVISPLSPVFHKYINRWEKDFSTMLDKWVENDSKRKSEYNWDDVDSIGAQRVLTWPYFKTFHSQPN